MNILNYYIRILILIIVCLVLVYYKPVLADTQPRMQTLISQYKATPDNLKDASTQNLIIEILIKPESRKSLDLSTKKIIEEQFKQNPDSENMILAALVGIESAQEKIKEIAAKPIPKEDWFGTDWAARLMMARLGDQASLNDILLIANRQNFHRKSTTVAIDFKYVPQINTLDFLKNQLFSDERLEPVKDTVPGSLAAKYAITSLAIILQNFPLDYREDFSYSNNEVIHAREWMDQQTEWKFR